MNKQQRKQIEHQCGLLRVSIDCLQALKDAFDSDVHHTLTDEEVNYLNGAEATASDTASTASDLKDEEQEKYDNMPDGLQSSERGEALENAVSELENAETAANDAETSMQEVQRFLEEGPKDRTLEDYVDSVCSSLQDAIDKLEEALEALDNASA